jgi:hypothetical protein
VAPHHRFPFGSPLLRTPCRWQLPPVILRSHRRCHQLLLSTALPIDPSTGTIDLSSSRSLMAPLRLSSHERVHMHRRLRPSSRPTATTTRSPPTHRTCTAHQQPPTTYGPRCHHRSCPPDHRRHEQPDSGEHSPF